MSLSRAPVRNDREEYHQGYRVRPKGLSTIYHVLAGEDQQAVTLPAVNRRGRQIECRVTATPLAQRDEVRGVILMMDELEE